MAAALVRAYRALYNAPAPPAPPPWRQQTLPDFASISIFFIPPFPLSPPMRSRRKLAAIHPMTMDQALFVLNVHEGKIKIRIFPNEKFGRGEVRRFKDAAQSRYQFSQASFFKLEQVWNIRLTRKKRVVVQLVINAVSLRIVKSKCNF